MVNENIVCRDESYGMGMGWIGEVDVDYALEGLTREAQKMFEG